MVEDEFACASNWDMLFTMQTIGLYADIYSRFMQAYGGCELLKVTSEMVVSHVHGL